MLLLQRMCIYIGVRMPLELLWYTMLCKMGHNSFIWHTVAALVELLTLSTTLRYSWQFPYWLLLKRSHIRPVITELRAEGVCCGWSQEAASGTRHLFGPQCFCLWPALTHLSRIMACSPKYSTNHQWRTCSGCQHLIEAFHIFTLVCVFHFHLDC